MSRAKRKLVDLYRVVHADGEIRATHFNTMDEAWAEVHDLETTFPDEKGENYVEPYQDYVEVY
jgi:hypothetical protein